MKKLLFLAILAIFSGLNANLKAQTAPTVQASNTTASYKYSSGAAVTITWTRGNGQNCMVVMRKSSSSQVYPTNGATPNWSPSASYGSGSSLGAGDNFVVYKGTGTGVYVYNLTPNTLYDVYVYEYNTMTIFSSTYYYYNTSTNGFYGFSTLATAPTSCGAITSASSITNSSATINFSSGNGNGRFVTMVPANLSATSPSNGYYYSASSAYGGGAAMGSGYAVYNSSGNSINVTGLVGATTYRVYDYEFENGTYPTYSTYNYNTKSYTSCGSYTFNTTNIPPTIASVTSQTICENTSLVVANLSNITDGSSNETQNLTVTASSSNTTLFPNGSLNVSYASPNNYGYVFMYPASGQYGTAVITVTVNDGWTVSNTTSVTYTITVLPFPGAAGAISGPSPVCAGTSHTYSISPTTNTTGYTWTVPTSGYTITAGANTNVITVLTATNATSGTIKVYGTNANGCGNGASSSFNLQVDAQPSTPNAGPDQPTVCGTSAVLNATAVSTPDAGTWSWYSGTPVPSIGTTTVNSTSITGLSGPNFTYKYIWTVTRAGSVCPSKTDTVTISTDWNNISCQPAAAFSYGPSSDVAPNKVCVNSTVNFTDLSVSANTWSWDFNYLGGAPNFTSSLQNPVYTYTQTGTYTVYLRIHSNATGLNYNTTQTINVITTPVTPGIIFGTNSGICEGSSNQYVYSISSVTDATGYNWTLPAGADTAAFPSLTSIAAEYPNGSVSGAVGVSASNSCGTSGTSTLAVTISPLPNSAGNNISGSAAVCQGQNNVAFTMSGYTHASSYTWTDLNGTQTTGTSTFTTNIGLSAINGNISVWGNNSCGVGDTVVLNLTVNPLPGPASGTAGMNNINLCPNPDTLLYVTNTVANATNYNWSLPAGASAVGGNGMDSLLVYYANGMAGGAYYISVYGSNTCGNGSADSVGINVNTPGAPLICMVTVDDSSTHNIIYWDKTSIAYADSFRIYREDVTNVYHQIGTVHYNSLSEFHDYDPLADPNATTKRYKISSIDSCGNESMYSPYHNTIYITDNGAGQFSWTQLYTIENGPNPVNNYVLMVDSMNNGNWGQIASTAGTQHNLNDVNYNHYAATANWRVETIWNISCTSTFRWGANNSQAAVVKSKSNITNNRNNTTGIKQNASAAVLVYPNPTTGVFTLGFAAPGKANIRVMSLLGAEVFSQTVQHTGAYNIDLSAFESGTYLVQVITDKGVTLQRVVKQ